jgi:hypothetical protein
MWRNALLWLAITRRNAELFRTLIRESRRAYSSAISNDASVLQLLTITYSQLLWVWASMLSMHSRNQGAPLNTGVTMLTRD